MNFMTSIQNELNKEKTLTENGAVQFKTSGKDLVDLNFATASLRNKSDAEITRMFAKVFYADKIHAMEWLAFLRDARGGMGERRSFRAILQWLGEQEPEYAKAILDLVAEYGRFDDLFVLVNTPVFADVVALVKKQLALDMQGMVANKPISLLAKWMPSNNTSSAYTRALAHKFELALHISAKEYRKTLAAMRKYLDVIEVKICDNDWSEIDYATVPSGANLKYGSAFMRHDAERRSAFFDKLDKGETKINASVLFPSDIVHQYHVSRYTMSAYNQNLEALWKALPDYVKEQGNTICVADGSGSMTSHIGSTGVTALEVANALAIYFAEHCDKSFKDKYITFSSKPQYVDFSNAHSLRDKLQIALQHDECDNTNIEAVFDLLLKTAKANHLTQAEIPNVLILSDMEFDSCACGNYDDNCANTRFYGYYSPRADKALFEKIADKWARAGYKLPRLTFWNICGRTGGVPLQQNDMGVSLVSGFSPAIMKMVLSAKLDPYAVLLETLESERYAPIAERVKGLR